MSYDMDPIVGNWYQHVEKGLDFEVVAVDEETASVEIQYVDGSLDDISLDDWYELDLEPAEPPEDWTGPLDDVETDDTDYTETGMQEEEWDESQRERPRRRGRSEGLEDDVPPDDELGGDWEE
ncbi:MAG TPA: DUF6763 family protein [Burkholderiaceae bacterium]|jgi:hypothetical protein|nr:DUF6763 family protein [Burkholderiaceae bacterium]